MGMTTLLDKTDLDPEQREYVRTARASGDALMTVINDILDFSKIEAGRLEVDAHDFDLPQAIDATCDVVATVAHQKGLQLHAYVDADVPQPGQRRPWTAGADPDEPADQRDQVHRRR